MRRLYILRHGIAVPHGTPGLADDDRPLTAKGRRRVRQIGAGLRRLDLEPKAIVTSPLPRAAETAQIVAEAMDLEEVYEEDEALRAGQTAESIRDWLRERPERELMIVGHNPALSRLIGVLVQGGEALLCELRKGGMAALVGNDAGYRIDWIATPRMLRRLG